MGYAAPLRLPSLRSTYLVDVGEHARHIRRHISDADSDPRSQTLALIPPDEPLTVAQEPEVTAIRKYAHDGLAYRIK
jgi:hypothetical protein